MFYRIDWLSVLLPLPDMNDIPWGEARSAVYSAAAMFFSGWWEVLVDGQDFVLEGGRAPFNLSIMRRDGGVRIFWSSHLNYALCEITGTGCAHLAAEHDLMAFAIEYQTDVSRVDLACDFETDVSPSQFAAERSVERFKSFGQVSSPTGETVYVGSLKSERYARVYRYNEPHPRCRFLRVEHVFRKESAKLALKYLQEHGVEDWVTAVGLIYGWTHSIWGGRIARNADGMAARTSERPEVGKTVFWLYQTVAPCIAKCIDEERLDWQDFVEAVHSELISRRAKSNPDVQEEQP